MPTPASSRVVTVSTIPGPWAKASGLGGKAEAQKVREGAGLAKVSIPGEYEAGDITTVRYFDALRDADLVAQLNTGDFTPFANSTIVDTAFDSAKIPVGRPIVSSGCVITSWELSDADANDEKLSEISLVWSVSR